MGDETFERGNWSSKSDYLLSVIGSAVGLGNVWRFPYLLYKNGGGAFLIPYTLMMALIGMPMFFLESSFGQFASLGPVAIWKAVPMFQGVGITMVLFGAIDDISYTCILAYSLYYLFASFQTPLPWADCFSWWGADETCSRTPKDPLCNLTRDDGYFEIVNTTWLHVNNATCPNGSEIYVPHQGPSEQYWETPESQEPQRKTKKKTERRKDEDDLHLFHLDLSGIPSVARGRYPPDPYHTGREYSHPCHTQNPEIVSPATVNNTPTWCDMFITWYSLSYVVEALLVLAILCGGVQTLRIRKWRKRAYHSHTPVYTFRSPIFRLHQTPNPLT